MRAIADTYRIQLVAGLAASFSIFLPPDNDLAPGARVPDQDAAGNILRKGGKAS